MSPSSIQLSLCMIVRDNEAIIEDCLKSIRPWVNEMIVVDTGSKDRTVEIAKALGAQVEFFPWCDDFSAARNASLEHANGQWLFWMDSDDRIDAVNGQKLRELTGRQHADNMLGYVMQVHCPSGGLDSGDVTAVDHVKLFRNHPQLRFEGRIHEQVLMPIRRLGGEVQWTDIFVVHAASDSSESGRKKKYERDLRILELDLHDRPDHPFVLFNFGMTYNDMGDHLSAIKWLRRCLDASSPGESHLRKAYALLASSLIADGDDTQALTVCNQGLASFPDDIELGFRRAVLLNQLGRSNEAIAGYWQLIHQQTPTAFASRDSGLQSFKALHNLATIYQDEQNFERAQWCWQKAHRIEPRFAPVRTGLTEILLRQHKWHSARIISRQWQQSESPAIVCDGQLLSARIDAAHREIAAASEGFQKCIEQFLDQRQPREACAQWLFETHQFEQAKIVLGELTEIFSDDGAAWHNLALCEMELGELENATTSFQRSLNARPGNVNTILSLASAWLQLDQPHRAIEMLQSQHNDFPDPQLLQMLTEIRNQQASP